MDNSGEAVDDQGSGWFQVKKRHRSSSKFSLHGSAAGFSGKNGSSFHITQPSLTEKNRNLCRKHVSHHSKGGSNHSRNGCGNAASSSSVSNQDESSVFLPHKLLVMQHVEDSGCSKLLPVLITNSHAKVGDTQKLKDKPNVLPKIKWGDLEDDVLILHGENNSQVVKKFVGDGNNNLVDRMPENNCHFVSHVSSSSNLQENILVASSVNVDMSPNQTFPFTNKEDILGKNSKDVSESSLQDLEVPSADDRMVVPNYPQNCKEKTTENSKTIDGFSCSTHPSGGDSVREVKLNVPVAVSEMHELKISELTVMSTNSTIIPLDSELLLTRSAAHEISELPVGNGNSGMVVIPQDSELLLLEKTNPEISTEFVKNSISTTAAIAKDNELLASERYVPEISEVAVTASVDDPQGPPDVALHNELLKVHRTGSLGEGDTGESKERFRERLWCFLFENLNRAVDELYLLCELECDVGQMKEAILVLEEAASDFKELTKRVQEFENVKRSSPQSIDVKCLKSEHHRPHAMSWEVRRMTTSSQRAEILSSSLETFKKIQQERANMLAANNTKILGLQCSSSHEVSVDHQNKSAGKSDLMLSAKDSVMKSRKQSGGSYSTQGNLNDKKQNIDLGRFNKVNFVKNGNDAPHDVSSSSANSSMLLSRDNSASGFVKGKRETEADVLLHKKDKTLSENAIDKNLKSAEKTTKKQIPLFEKDKERRNSSSRKSMEAWKERRNWEDILSSPFCVSSRLSHSPGISRKSAERARILHAKLMSPDKKKKTAFDLKREAEEKHARAMRIRSELENERVQKLQRTSEKLNRVNEWQAVRTMKLREGMYARHQRGESRHEAFLAQVVRRAGDESSKVNEVRFITSLNEENKKLMLRQKLHDSELRRAEKLQVIKTKQKEDMAREEAVLERRKLIEAEKLQRLAETQRKKEEAQVRREEERKASNAAREARAIVQLRRREERAKAQQEEAELLAQKLAERLSESEQRRKFYLEQIRERASMDFRDQSSPLMRRSMYKEGQGRTTPTHSSEDYQVNNVAGAGSSTLAAGKALLQHSMKRRIKKIRQRLMALRYEFTEPPASSENTGMGYRMAVGTARAKFGRWLQELQRLRQARKKGAASIGLITAEMIKFVEGKDPELQASRQAGLLDFIAAALPASHTSNPETCQVTIHLLKLLRVVLSAPANRSYFLSQNLLPPIIPMLSAALENYIKIAASLNVPGSINLQSSKTSVENFGSISEVLDNFLWTVGTVIGHASSDEQQVQMRDGLLELLIAYQVIHRLRDLFALYDRPQVEGSPFPSSILLSIHLLVALTYRPGTNSSINWESSPVKTVLGFENQEAKPIENASLRFSSVVMTSEDLRPSLFVLNCSPAVLPPNVSEDIQLDESCDINEIKESVSISKDGEQKPQSYVELNITNTNTRDVKDEAQKNLIEEKDLKQFVSDCAEHKNNVVLNMKEPVAFLLSAISETGLVSLPSLLTAVLLQANNRLSSEQGSYILPSNFEEVATGVLKVLNNLALLDIVFMQRMLARPDLKMEFFHLMSFLLSHCTSKWKVANDQVGFLLLECLSLLGYFALFHTENQAVLRWGKSPTILHKICDLPFVFFSDTELIPVLAGALVAACYGCEQNKCVVQQELSMDMLVSLLRSCRNVLPEMRSNPIVENLPTEDANESNQQISELKRSSQGDILQRSNRYNSRSLRVSMGKTGTFGNNIRGGKMRCQRDGKTTKTSEEMALKYNPVAPQTSMMLHCRFPGSFMDRAEQFFTAGMTNVADEI
uniref:S phase cyclin A-associated protein in the endoplasmic reticulum N-terminal domain-containing protein n=1 Tax=Salix viminalis TaxID=40686 RepID=A0A6N2N2F9_SALVM